MDSLKDQVELVSRGRVIKFIRETIIPRAGTCVDIPGCSVYWSNYIQSLSSDPFNPPSDYKSAESLATAISVLMREDLTYLLHSGEHIDPKQVAKMIILYSAAYNYFCPGHKCLEYKEF